MLVLIQFLLRVVRVARSPVFYGRSRIFASVSRLPEGSRWQDQSPVFELVIDEMLCTKSELYCVSWLVE